MGALNVLLSLFSEKEMSQLLILLAAQKKGLQWFKHGWLPDSDKHSFGVSFQMNEGVDLQVFPWCASQEWRLFKLLKMYGERPFGVALLGYTRWYYQKLFHYVLHPFRRYRIWGGFATSVYICATSFSFRQKNKMNNRKAEKDWSQITLMLLFALGGMKWQESKCDSWAIGSQVCFITHSWATPVHPTSLGA